MKYVDTDVLVYWATDHPDHGDTATRLLKHIELNEKAVTSALALYLFDQVLDELAIDGYDLETFLNQLGKLRNLRIEPVTGETLRRAAQVRRELDVPLDVAVGLIVAKDRRADAVFSKNAAYDKGDLPRRFAQD